MQLIRGLLGGMPAADLVVPRDDLFHFMPTHGKWDECGDREAIICHATGRRFLYRELQARFRAAGGALAAMGFKKGDMLSIHLHNCVEFTFAVFASAAIGGVATASNPMYEVGELNHLWNDAQAVICVTSTKYKDVVEKVSAPSMRQITYIEDGACFVHATVAPAGFELPQGGARPDPDSLVALPYSSGTTGKAKGVMLKHMNIVSNILQGVVEHSDIRWDINEGDKIMTTLPLFHIYGFTIQMLTSLYRRATVVVIPKFDPSTFVDDANAYKVSVACVVPPILLFFDKLASQGAFDVPTLRHAVSAAAHLDPNLQERVTARCGFNCRQGYGATETSPTVSLIGVKKESMVVGSIGRVLPLTSVKVVDAATHELVSTGTQGELCVQGPQVMVGYLNRPDATATSLIDGWYHAGDVAHVDASGHIFLGARIKDMIKIQGFQVAPAELEGVLREHPVVDDVCVIGVPDEYTGEAAIAFVVLKDASFDADSLRSCFEGRLASFKTPREFIPIEKVPKSAAGKVLARILKDDYLVKNGIEVPAQQSSATSDPHAARPRLLCLHGRASNVQVAQMQCTFLGLDGYTGPNGEEILGSCECTYLPAPLKTDGVEVIGEVEGRAWFVDGDVDSMRAGLQYVASHVLKEGPFDGVFGFAQATSLVSMLSKPEVWQSLSGGKAEDLPWRFAILANGYLANGSDRLLTGSSSSPLLALPTVHLMGKHDRILGESQALAARYADPTIHVLDAAHKIPMSLLLDGKRESAVVLSSIGKFVSGFSPAAGSGATARVPPSMPRGKPRLLCLHGLDSNADVTRLQCTLLGLDDMCDCTYLTAPFDTGGAEARKEGAYVEVMENATLCSWYRDGEPASMSEGLRYVIDHVAKEGPYDGVYAFSQGSCVASVLSDLGAWKSLGGARGGAPWRFIIIACGSDRFWHREGCPATTMPLQLPTLHIMGKDDPIFKESKQLAARYAKPVTHVIDAGHSIPFSIQDGSDASKVVLDAVASFVATDHPERGR